MASSGELKRTAPDAQPKFLKATLLVIFCFAQFLDAFNNSALFAAIPPIAVDLNISNSTSVWLISAYQLTFAALLLSVSFLRSTLSGWYIQVNDVI